MAGPGRVGSRVCSGGWDALASGQQSSFRAHGGWGGRGVGVPCPGGRGHPHWLQACPAPRPPGPSLPTEWGPGQFPQGISPGPLDQTALQGVQGPGGGRRGGRARRPPAWGGAGGVMVPPPSKDKLGPAPPGLAVGRGAGMGSGRPGLGVSAWTPRWASVWAGYKELPGALLRLTGPPPPTSAAHGALRHVPGCPSSSRSASQRPGPASCHPDSDTLRTTGRGRAAGRAAEVTQGGHAGGWGPGACGGSRGSGQASSPGQRGAGREGCRGSCPRPPGSDSHWPNSRGRCELWTELQPAQHPHGPG